jgi:hypothetical protein
VYTGLITAVYNKFRDHLYIILNAGLLDIDPKDFLIFFVGQQGIIRKGLFSYRAQLVARVPGRKVAFDTVAPPPPPFVPIINLLPDIDLTLRAYGYRSWASESCK